MVGWRLGVSLLLPAEWRPASTCLPFRFPPFLGLELVALRVQPQLDPAAHLFGLGDAVTILDGLEAARGLGRSVLDSVYSHYTYLDVYVNM